MTDKERVELIRIAGACAIVCLEWYCIQPYHPPVFARMWDSTARFCAFLANLFGWWAMYARENYYKAVSSGS